MQATRCQLQLRQARPAVPSLHRPQPHATTCKSVCNATRKGEQQTQLTILQQVSRFAVSAAVAVAALASPLTASAALVETVPVSQATQMAKPLPKQQSIDKTKVWTVFIGGAAGLFLLTIAAENNKSWFPAIARANEAMAVARKRAEEAEKQKPPSDIPATAVPVPKPAVPPPAAAAAAAASDDDLPPLEVESALLEAEIERRNALAEREAAALAAQAESARQQKFVEEGLLEAKKRVLENGSSSSSGGADPAEASSSSSSSNGAGGSSTASSSDGSSSGYTVVAEPAVAAQGVAWQADAVEVPSSSAAAAAAEPDSGDSAVSAAALNGLLESRDLMQQYRQQQQQHQPQQQEVRQ